MTAARRLLLARAAMRAAATHFDAALTAGGPLTAEQRDEIFAQAMHLKVRATTLGATIQAVQGADSERRRARRALTPPRGT